MESTHRVHMSFTYISNLKTGLPVFHALDANASKEETNIKRVYFFKMLVEFGNFQVNQVLIYPLAFLSSF